MSLFGGDGNRERHDRVTAVIYDMSRVLIRLWRCCFLEVVVVVSVRSVTVYLQYLTAAAAAAVAVLQFGGGEGGVVAVDDDGGIAVLLLSVGGGGGSAGGMLAFVCFCFGVSWWVEW